MKQTTTEIAVVDNPITFSLAGNPNFIRFRSLDSETKSATVDVYLILKTNTIGEASFSITDQRATTNLSFRGTDDPKNIGADRFYISKKSKEITLENIKACLMKNAFLRDNFILSTSPLQKDRIRIVSRRSGGRYAFTFATTAPNVFAISGNPLHTINQDSISRNPEYAKIANPASNVPADYDEDCEIHLEVYADTGVLPGKDGTPTDSNMGVLQTTLTKNYLGDPLWFDVNTVVADKGTAPRLAADGWFDTGTCTDHRYVAKRYSGKDVMTFYYSDVCYVINGFRRTLDTNNLSPDDGSALADYVYNTAARNTISPLSNRLEATHIRGQKQFFNFILCDKATADQQLSLRYKVASPSGVELGQTEKHQQGSKAFAIVNTIALDIDSLLDTYPNAGHIEVSLCHNGDEVSRPLRFRILPEHLYGVKDFVFLNALGGWSSFSFGGRRQTEFSAAKTTSYRTRTPDSNTIDRIESVDGSEATEAFVVQSLPISPDVADWLKELSVSSAVYELSTGRYIVVDELNVKHTSKDDLLRLEMKYHYSDSYNSRF